MNQPAVYTPLESLFLFQSLLIHGVDGGAFTRISELLINNTLIKEDSTYDPSRLKPDALRQLFLLLLRDELKSEHERVDGPDGATGSPSKKRKLGTPPMPMLKDVYDNVEKVPILVDRLYARYRDNVVSQIREDEKRFTKVQGDIHLLERTERERRARAASQNGTLAIAPRDSKPATASNGPTPTPLPSSAVTPVAPRRLPTSHTPVIPPKPPTPLAATPTVAAPSHLPPGTTPIRPSPVAKPSNGTGSVLQAPAGVPQSAPRPLQAPAQTPKQAITPRPEVGIKPKDTPAIPQAATPVSAPLKWEKPYQPPHTATPTPRQTPAQQGQATPSVPQQPQQQTPQQQQWHPQPTPQYPPQTPGQHTYPRPQQPQHAQQPQPSRPQPPLQPQSTQQPQRQTQQHPQKPPPPQPQPQKVLQQHPQPPQPPKPQPQAQAQAQAQAQGQVQAHVQAQAQAQAQAQQAQAQTQAQAQVQRPQQPLPPKQSQPPKPAQPPQPRSTPGKPVPVPQPPAQLAPPLQPALPRPAGEAPGAQAAQARPSSTTPVPPPTRPLHPPQPQPPQVARPIASASPVPPATVAAPIAPSPTPQRWSQAQPPQQAQTAPKPPASPAPAASQKDKSYNSPYATQPPRPAIPEHVIRQAINTPTKRLGTPSAPHTPVSATPSHLLHGFGTRWAPHSTPSTPKPLSTEPQSPAFEPVSPPQQPATLASSAASTPKPPTKKNTPKPVLKTEPIAAAKPVRGRAARTSQKGRGVSATPSLPRTRRSQSVMSHTDEPMIESSEPGPKIKDEEATPRPAEETGDTTADESVPGRPQIVTPGSVSSRLQKRKRQDSPPESPLPPTQVLWTRGFTKVSSSALDQISSHRDANMFATALREKDAPGYRQIVLQPQDITSIRSAIKHGNKAAVQAAASLPGGDPGTAHVMLPLSEELVPPKGIINSAQLERELVHMFCNAIMYNPDPDRGPGPAFLKRSQDEEEEVVGYRLDENGIVKNTRSMFIEVEKLLGDLRSAEKERSAPPPSATRPASVATPAEDTAAEEEEEATGERDASAGTGKRRRVGRG